ncbi:hypothetical protein PACTADRAFT_77290 [Pachysolen tannophilus NRRL Y-2460]|uniref:2-isopropylmalate synthase n=1 Tax=Pachysolen tannophilus NRRL Y-2460 TaxID=669874 RepID=A0A1E4TPU4_PACTA|nr:hypothetical protein PACTADRAFT_77290 [Pachysolen tannophilus NRRL Y-2460]
MFKKTVVAFQKSAILKEGVVTAYKNLLKDPSLKYKAAPKINLSNRQWPSKTIERAPRWLSTDLRDGNQSLPDPMSVEQKKKYFHKLIELGFKEIEVSFPSASQTDFDFTRYAVENAPEDVSIQVLTQSREHLIRRTVESVKGAKRATIHTYLATSDLFRDVVFNMSQEDAIKKAIETTKLIRSLTKDHPDMQETRWSYEFSPECFSDTPVKFAVEICEAVKQVWEPTVDNPIIFNLPATVEVASPNIYADQIEYFSTHISEREKVCISLHPHNDRGCAVAAAELGLLAGGDRIEGCLFGNGERTGNIDLVTAALNMYTHGISPNLDFSDMDSVVAIVEECNKIPVHPRAPYGGSLVVCAFSGSHQDAIKKGFTKQQERWSKNDDKYWAIPYLPIDPKDIGRNYEAIIRVNSQSGKGGAAWIILKSLGLDLPRKLQISFSTVVQHTAESMGRELKSEEICSLFKKKYNLENVSNNTLELIDFDIVRTADKNVRNLTAEVSINGKIEKLTGSGNGPISTFVNAISKRLNTYLNVVNYHEHSLGQGSDTKAVTYIELSNNDNDVLWGIGIDEDVSTAAMNSILAAVNVLIKEGKINLEKAEKVATA